MCLKKQANGFLLEFDLFFLLICKQHQYIVHCKADVYYHNLKLLTER